MKMAFKYKLSLSVVLIVLAVLVGFSLVLHADIEEDALVRIDAQLAVTRERVTDLIEERQRDLDGLAAMVGGSRAVRDLLDHPTLKEKGRDDIVEKLILSGYPRLELLCIIGPGGTMLGANTVGRRLQTAIMQSQVLGKARKGRQGQGVLFVQGGCMQITAVPIYFDDQSAGSPAGIVLAGIGWRETDLERILDLSGVQVALIQGSDAVLSTGKPFRRPGESGHLIALLPIGWATSQSPILATVDNERFLFLKVPDDQGTFPLFVIAKSLDKELTFVSQIRTEMIAFGLAGIGLGIGVSLFFGISVSRPLQMLVAATEKIEAGDYESRVPVKGHDEFSQLSQSFNRMAEGLQQRDYIRNTFGRYIDPQVARELLQRPEAAALGGVKRDVPIVMADIRGFTTICERLSPAATIAWLNAYFSHIMEVINQHRGIIIDFIGDAVLFYLDPLDGPLGEATIRAVQCALELQRQAGIFNTRLKSPDQPEVQIGIGVHAGQVIIGNIGSEDRRKFGIVGSAVNLTQRIQGYAGSGEIVVSQAVLMEAGPYLRVSRSFDARLKGIRYPVRLHTISGDDMGSATV